MADDAPKMTDNDNDEPVQDDLAADSDEASIVIDESSKSELDELAHSGADSGEEDFQDDGDEDESSSALTDLGTPDDVERVARMLTEQNESTTTGQESLEASASTSGRAKKKKKGQSKKRMRVLTKGLVVADEFDELPKDFRAHIKKSKVDMELVNNNFEVVLNILHFQTRKNLTTRNGLRNRTTRKRPPPGRFDSDNLDAASDELLVAGDQKKLFKQLNEVGSGGFGRVFSSKSTLDKHKGKAQKVAIKRMPHVTSRDKRRNFKEIRYLKFVDHPNIVKYFRAYDFSKKEKKGKKPKESIKGDNEIWIVMEFMQGGTLTEACEEYEFSEENIAYVAREMLLGLAYLHKNKIAHRDVKSANVMMSVDGDIKLIDFGLCADMSTAPNESRTEMCGSPFWMPPEMIQKRPHSYKVDIWSTAICLLELANGRPPNKDSSFRAMLTAASVGYPQPFDKPEKWSDTMKDFFRLMLTQDTDKRPDANTLLEHAFINKASSNKSMEDILTQIFLSNALANSGFGI